MTTAGTTEGAGLRERLKSCEARLRSLGGELARRAGSPGTLGPAEACLLDQFTYVHGKLREAREALSSGYCRKLKRAGVDPLTGAPRIYRRIADRFRNGAAEVSAENLRECLEREGTGEALRLAEIWAAPPVLALALVEEILEAIESRETAPEKRRAAVERAVSGLRAAERLRWRELIERVSVVDRALRHDPGGVYGRMEFESRDLYRQAVEKMAESSRLSEEEVALLAVAMAWGEEPGTRRAHVGYFLVDAGAARLRKRARCRMSPAETARALAYRFPNAVYLGGIAAAACALVAALRLALPALPDWWLALAAIPATQAAVAAVNLSLTRLLPPRRLARMDFSEGIPAECASFVAVPTLLLTRAGIESLLQRLEVHYLANRDGNLRFALLTDHSDSALREGGKPALVEACAEGIRRLNARYGQNGRGPFYLFHRGHEWNGSEGTWMGRERKRGKLEDFNAFLLGAGDAFERKEGDLEALPAIRYVITLDSDTQLPLDSARKLVGTLAHPLNRAVMDELSGTVREGYGILQPRVSISMESASRSLLARICSGQTGLDPYSKAVSDVYQDLYGRATYTGKGIYDVAAFTRALDGRFPDNALLSHDLIEGEHTRVGLVSDVEVIDDYPSSYKAFTKRKHRWVRGDWQILFWALPRVPVAGGGWRANVLPMVSRWKIADNLRRSLVEPMLAAALAAAWWLAGRAALDAGIAAAAILLAPAWLEFALGLVRLPPPRFWRGYLRDRLAQLGRGHGEALLTLVFLPHQGAMMLDAVGRTLYRRLWSGRKLLEWESMAQVETEAGFRWNMTTGYLFGTSCAALVCLPLAAGLGGDAAVLGAAALWVMAPLAAAILDEKPVWKRRAERANVDFLRDSALLTWRYFAEYGREEWHWLAPDNVQEDPEAVAARTSPTNIGLQLAAQVAAFDFGYLMPGETIESLNNILNTLGAMERYRGHLYNWYDTVTLEPLEPRYVSTVDSGNLAAALVAVKQACEGFRKQPVARPAVLEGLRDHCLRLGKALPASGRSQGLASRMEAILRQLDYRPAGLFAWEGLLREVAGLVAGLDRHVEWVCQQREAGAAGQTGELRYWQAALSRRVEAARSQLESLAPWLGESYGDQIRACGCMVEFEPLMKLLERTPGIDQLPAHYEAIDREIETMLDAQGRVHGPARVMLERLRAELPVARARSRMLMRMAERQSKLCSKLAMEMDFRFLFDSSRQLLRIGCDAATGRLDESCYDLLASEARTALFFAIAKGDAPCESWFRLGRKLVMAEGERTLLSWSGTMFEYLMPLLFMKNYPGTLVAESCAAMVRIQRRHGRRRRTPWGISESAYRARDSAGNYQYRAFGVPGIAMQTGSAERLVVAPYATMLALMVDRASATENLRSMAARRWLGRFGFYEAVEFSGRRLDGRARTEVIRSYMVHHQGMSLLSLANVLLEDSQRMRFHADPLVRATELLLQERVPAMVEGEALETPPVAVDVHGGADLAGEWAAERAG